MFPKAKVTNHKNKSLKYADGGSVRDPNRRMEWEDYRMAENRGEYPALNNVPMESGRTFRNPFRSDESKTVDAIDDPVREGRNEERRADAKAALYARTRLQMKLEDERKAREKRTALEDTPPLARKGK
jgi:hypothetical protein